MVRKLISYGEGNENQRQADSVILRSQLLGSLFVSHDSIRRAASLSGRNPDRYEDFNPLTYCYLR